MSPIARMIAVVTVEWLISKGFLTREDASKSVEDFVSIIGTIAMIISLLIWQWRVRHPMRAHIEADMPITEIEVKKANRLKESLKNWFVKKFTEHPTKPTLPEQA